MEEIVQEILSENRRVVFVTGGALVKQVPLLPFRDRGLAGSRFFNVAQKWWTYDLYKDNPRLWQDTFKYMYCSDALGRNTATMKEPSTAHKALMHLINTNKNVRVLHTGIDTLFDEANGGKPSAKVYYLNGKVTNPNWCSGCGKTFSDLSLLQCDQCDSKVPIFPGVRLLSIGSSVAEAYPENYPWKDAYDRAASEFQKADYVVFVGSPMLHSLTFLNHYSKDLYERPNAQEWVLFAYNSLKWMAKNRSCRKLTPKQFIHVQGTGPNLCWLLANIVDRCKEMDGTIKSGQVWENFTPSPEPGDMKDFLASLPRLLEHGPSGLLQQDDPMNLDENNNKSNDGGTIKQEREEKQDEQLEEKQEQGQKQQEKEVEEDNSVVVKKEGIVDDEDLERTQPFDGQIIEQLPPIPKLGGTEEEDEDNKSDVEKDLELGSTGSQCYSSECYETEEEYSASMVLLSGYKLNKPIGRRGVKVDATLDDLVMYNTNGNGADDDEQAKGKTNAGGEVKKRGRGRGPRGPYKKRAAKLAAAASILEMEEESMPGSPSSSKRPRRGRGPGRPPKKRAGPGRPRKRGRYPSRYGNDEENDDEDVDDNATNYTGTKEVKNTDDFADIYASDHFYLSESEIPVRKSGRGRKSSKIAFFHELLDAVELMGDEPVPLKRRQVKSRSAICTDYLFSNQRQLELEQNKTINGAPEAVEAIDVMVNLGSEEAAPAEAPAPATAVPAATTLPATSLPAAAATLIAKTTTVPAEAAIPAATIVPAATTVPTATTMPPIVEEPVEHELEQAEEDDDNEEGNEQQQQPPPPQQHVLIEPSTTMV